MEAVQAAFRGQALASAAVDAPLTGLLCRLVAEHLPQLSGAVAERLSAWPGDPVADAVPMRLAGGLHALVLSGADPALAEVYRDPGTEPRRLWPPVAAALQAHEALLLTWLDSPPQTNETGRAAMLLPGFLLLARRFGLPLRLFEIGSSAGLNLSFDRFRHRYGEVGWGPLESPVRLATELRGPAPDLGGALLISGRRGCDLAPIDLGDPRQCLRLMSYVWADQAERLARCRAAIAIALEDRHPLETADAGDFVARMLSATRPGETTVLFHTVMWPYVPDTTRARIEAALATAGVAAAPDRPLAWLRYEGDFTTPEARLTLTAWPDGATEDLACGDYHGRWIAWRGGASSR